MSSGPPNKRPHVAARQGGRPPPASTRLPSCPRCFDSIYVLYFAKMQHNTQIYSPPQRHCVMRFINVLLTYSPNIFPKCTGMICVEETNENEVAATGASWLPLVIDDVLLQAERLVCHECLSRVVGDAAIHKAYRDAVAWRQQRTQHRLKFHSGIIFQLEIGQRLPSTQRTRR